MPRALASLLPSPRVIAVMGAVILSGIMGSGGARAQQQADEGGSRGVHRVTLKAVTRDEQEPIELYGESHALLIGASEYSVWPKLSSIASELDGVEQVLSDTGFSVQRLVDPDAEALVGGVKAFIDEHGYEPQNRLLIYFSGHGHSVGEKGFLLPVDIPDPIERRAFRQKALPMTQVMAWARDMEAKHVLFVFDSCFAGSVFKSKSMPEPDERYIRSVTSQPVRQFITAGSANEEVPAKSTFTPAFVDAIRGEGDLNGDGYITGSELGVHLSQLVPRFVEQTPQYGKIDDYELARGDFVFFTGKPAEPIDPVAPLASVPTFTDVPASAMEVMVWQSSEKGDTPGEYEAYLNRYPDGAFADIARARIANLSQGGTGKIEKFFYEPDTVSLPAGSFLMGSSDGRENERPVRVVRVEPFEISRHEITFDQFDQFTLANAIESVPDNGWGRGDRPVINVSWKLAKEYTRWLSNATGRRYRLPVEAEWEYAARAGRIEPYGAVDEPSALCAHANLSFKTDACDDDSPFTTPVGAFEPNAWGLHDMQGNVWEWTEDCWHPDYFGAPENGRAWTSAGDCDLRVVRGGAWYSETDQLRPAYRNRNKADSGSDSTGFRVVLMPDAASAASVAAR